MSGVKRSFEGKDPDYEDVSTVVQNKRQRVMEQSARDATVQRIEAIIREQFAQEVKNKEHEIEIIDLRLAEARRMMDKLRACIVASYYASAAQPRVSEGGERKKSVESTAFNHPAIRKFMDPPSRSSSPANQRSDCSSQGQSETESIFQPSDERDGCRDERERATEEDPDLAREERRPCRNTPKDTFGVPSVAEVEKRRTYLQLGDDPSRLYFKKTIVVGNVSKYIAPEKREENDQSTHKWMIYVRGSRREPRIDHFVKKVWFFLHPSYKPNDLVEVSEPPFHLTRRGWGEFPVRVQLHFKDLRNKRVDIIHQLKLDRTYTGLQTLGAETVVDVELDRRSLSDEPVSASLPPPAPVLRQHLTACVSALASPFPSSPPPAAATTAAAVAGTGGRSLPSGGAFSSSSSSSLDTTPALSPSPRAQATAATTAGSSGAKLVEVKKECVDRFLTISGGGSRVEGPNGEPGTAKEPAGQRPTFSPHCNSAFQPITASCKIVPQGKLSTLGESPGRSFQPLTVSCKIVSAPSPVPKVGTAGGVEARSPVSKLHIHGSSFVSMSAVKEEALFATMPPLGPIGSQAKLQTPKAIPATMATQTTLPKVLLHNISQMVIKQEPMDVQPSPSAGPSQQPLQQFVTMKGGPVITVPSQKTASLSTTTHTPTKVLGIQAGCSVSPAKQTLTLSSGQILLAKPLPQTAKLLPQKAAAASTSGPAGQKGITVVTTSAGGVQKPMLMGTATVAAGKAVMVSSVGASILSQSSATTGGVKHPPGVATASSGTTKPTQGQVLATLQLPATNLANLASLPPGTKLYLSTHGKHASGRGKLLLIPQGAVLRTSAGQTLQGSAGGAGSGVTSSSSAVLGSLQQHGKQPPSLPYTSYILKQTPQGTFLVGQPASSSSSSQPSPVKAAGSPVQPHPPGSPSPGPARVPTPSQQAAVITQIMQPPGSPSVHPTPSSSPAGPEASPARITTPAALPQHVVPAAGATMSGLTLSLSRPPSAHILLSPGQQLVATPESGSSPAHQVVLPTGVSLGNKPVSTTAAGMAALHAAGFPGKAVATKSAGGTLKLQSSGSPAGPQQAVLSIPASQLKQPAVPSASSGVHTALLPLQPLAKAQAQSSSGPVMSPSTEALPPNSPGPTSLQVKTEPGTAPLPVELPGASGPLLEVKSELPSPGVQDSTSANVLVDVDHIENIDQLLTAIVKKVPLLVSERAGESTTHPFCATSLEQFYSWNIGKRRAAEWQRAACVRRLASEILDGCHPRLAAPTHPAEPLGTRRVMAWCRQRGYTPPDPATAGESQESLLEEILTQIDSEPEVPSSLSCASDLHRRLEELEARLSGAEALAEDDEEDAEVDVVEVTGDESRAAVRVKREVKQEPGARAGHPHEGDARLFLGSGPAEEFVRESAREIGINLAPTEVDKNVFAPLVETMIMKATEQFMSDVMREALRCAYDSSPRNRPPRELCVQHLQQALCSLPTCDFVTNKNLGVMLQPKQQEP
uniref:YEATS domain-containing protein 2 n=1 Tax=Petromyzon marinus TaxID=7757 RepID=A0AAJ7U9C4_PETMA|nr:YEATS domain-containing protein 2 isoform X7 [Petromyzon marinus]